MNSPPTNLELVAFDWQEPFIRFVAQLGYGSLSAGLYPAQSMDNCVSRVHRQAPTPVLVGVFGTVADRNQCTASEQTLKAD